MAHRPRILFVINSLAGGGAERVMLSILTHSRGWQEEYDFSLALLDDEKRAYAPPAWLTVHQLNSRFSLVRSVRALAGLERRLKPDLVLSFLTRSNMANVAVGTLRRRRSLISERANTSGHFKPGLSGRLAKGMIRTLYPRADSIIAPSQGIADDLIAAFACRPDRLRVIPNPVDSTAIRAMAAESVERPFGPDAPYAVAVSRLVGSKNVLMLIEALAQTPQPINLLVLGEGAERERISRRIGELGLQDRVAMPGFATNPYALMREAAFYLSASNGEGFPNGLVEALALGLPVAATNCASGPSEILDDRSRESVSGLTEGRYGFLVPPNDVAAMAQAMERLTNPARAAEYRLLGPMRAADYSVERATAAFWDLIVHGLGDAARQGVPSVAGLTPS